MSKEAMDMLMGGGGVSATWPEVGTVYKGRLLSMEKRQQRDVDGNKKTWDDGEPMWQIVFTIDTGEIDPSIEDDDGVRRIYSKPQMLDAIRDAVRQVGHKGDLVGGKLAVKYVGDGPKKNPRYNAPKHFAAKYEAPSEADMLDDASVNRDEEPAQSSNVEDYGEEPF